MSTVLEIPSCSVAQLVESETLPLADGTLSLFQSEDDESLTVLIQEMAFPLSKTSPVFTHSQNNRWYFFAVPGAQGSFIRVTLPEGVEVAGSKHEKLRDQLEDKLIKQGLLQSGFLAAGDELGSSVKQEAVALSATIASQVETYTGSHPPTSTPATFSAGTHSLVEGASSNTSSAVTYSSRAAEAFASATIGLGERLVGLFGGNQAVEDTANLKSPPDVTQKLHSDLEEAGYPVDPQGSKGPGIGTQVADAAKTAASGIGEGLNTVGGAITSGVQQVVGHDYGAEAASLSAKTGQVTSNVGQTLNNVVIESSPVVQSVKAAAKPADKDGPVYTV